MGCLKGCMFLCDVFIVVLWDVFVKDVFDVDLDFKLMFDDGVCVGMKCVCVCKCFVVGEVFGDENELK